MCSIARRGSMRFFTPRMSDSACESERRDVSSPDPRARKAYRRCSKMCPEPAKDVAEARHAQHMKSRAREIAVERMKKPPECRGLGSQRQDRAGCPAGPIGFTSLRGTWRGASGCSQGRGRSWSRRWSRWCRRGFGTDWRWCRTACSRGRRGRSWRP